MQSKLIIKKLFLLIAIFNLLAASGLSQVTTVVDGLNYPQRLLLVDNLLYFSIQNTISYIDINDPNPTPIILISNLNQPAGLEIKNDFLYVAQFQGGDIIKIDLNDPAPSPINVVSYGGTPNMLQFIGNDLYFTDGNDNRIYKFDVTSGLPDPEVILNNTTGTYGPLGLEIKDNFLYYNIPLLGTVYKFDLNNPSSEPIEVVSSLDHPLGMAYKDGALYVADIDDDLIAKIDVGQSPAVVVNILANLNRPNDITFDGDIMYFTQRSSISKVDVSTLGFEGAAQDEIRLYPNPASDHLTISNLKDEIEFTIYDCNGRSLKTGMIFPNEQININDLSQGYYFIRFEEDLNTIKKFIKN